MNFITVVPSVLTILSICFNYVNSSSFTHVNNEFVLLSEIYLKHLKSFPLTGLVNDPNYSDYIVDVLTNTTAPYDDSDDDEYYNRTLCDIQFNYFLENLNSSEGWALRLFDSWGRMPSGIFYGNTHEFGIFDECLEYEHTFENETLGTLTGQFCLGHVHLNLNHFPYLKLNKSYETTEISFATGMCIPSYCSPAYYQTRLKFILHTFGLHSPKIIDQNAYCYIAQHNSMEFEGAIIPTTLLLIFVFLLMISSTIFDIISTDDEKKAYKRLLAFSLPSNVKSIFSSKNYNDEYRLNCLNGMRVLSLIWIVYCHGVSVFMKSAIMNFNYIEEWISNIYSMVILWSSVAVDTFLLLSGLLITWNMLRALKVRGKINIPLLYMHRYIRLSASYGMLILFTVSLYQYVGTGPLFKAVIMPAVEDCKANWWSALLYIQNYVNPSEICVEHSWYLSIDMQLFILSPLIIIPLWKWGRRTIIGIIVLIVISLVSNFLVFYFNELNLNIFETQHYYRSSGFDTMAQINYPTHIRAIPWLIGVLLGYFLFMSHTKTIRISKRLCRVSWIASILTMVSIVFGPYKLQQIDYEESLVESTIYIVFSRIGWSLSISWIIFACIKGYGGVVNKFLSFYFWAPLARQSYAIYLIHGLLQMAKQAMVRNTEYFNDFNAIYNFWGDFGITFLISILWVAAFESPVLVFEKMFCDRITRKRDELLKNMEESEKIDVGIDIEKD